MPKIIGLGQRAKQFKGNAMKNQRGLWPRHPRRVEYSLATDSGVLSEGDVENARAHSPEPNPRLPRVLYGIRNGLILSGLLWALILLVFYIF